MNMERLVIQNDMDLLCLGEILKDYPKLLDKVGAKPSAISSAFIRETLEKILKICEHKKGGIKKQ